MSVLVLTNLRCGADRALLATLIDVLRLILWLDWASTASPGPSAMQAVCYEKRTTDTSFGLVPWNRFFSQCVHFPDNIQNWNHEGPVLDTRVTGQVDG